MSVSRLVGSESVTVDIAASTGLRVEPTSVTLTDRAIPGVTTVTADVDYSGTATVTFEAVGYESTLVNVTITRAPTPNWTDQLKCDAASIGGCLQGRARQ